MELDVSGAASYRPTGTDVAAATDDAVFEVGAVTHTNAGEEDAPL